MTKSLRSFLAIGLPLLVMLALAASLPRDLGEPAFVKDWSIEARASGLFVAILSMMIALAVAWDRWSRRIEPEVFAAREPLSLVDNLGTEVTTAAVLAFAAYHKPLAVAGWNFTSLSLVYLAVTVPVLGWQMWRSRRRYSSLKAESKSRDQP